MTKKIKRIYSSLLMIVVMLLSSCIYVSAADTALPEEAKIGTTEMEIREDLGLRIFSYINEDYLEELKSSGKSVEYGTLAIQATVMESSGDQAGDRLVSGESYRYSGKTYRVVQIKAAQNWARKEGKIYFTGVLTGVSGAGFNTRYAARAYVKVGDQFYYGDIMKESGYSAAQKMVSSEDVNISKKEAVIAKVIDACDAKKAGAFQNTRMITSTDVKGGSCVLDGADLPRNFEKVIVTSDVPDTATITLKDIRAKELEIQDGAQCTIKAEGHTIFDSIETTAPPMNTVSLFSQKSTGKLKLLLGGESWLKKLVAATDMQIASTSQDGKGLAIPTLEVADTVQLDVDVPVEKVIVDTEAQGSFLELSQEVEKVELSAGVTIAGEAKIENVEVKQPVTDLVIENDMGKLTLSEAAGGSSVKVDGKVDKAVIHGENSTITGEGTITQAEGDAKNEIDVPCPPLNKIISVEATDATHLTVRMENAGTKFTLGDFSLTEKQSSSIEITSVVQKDGTTYELTTENGMKNGTVYCLCAGCLSGDAGKKEFTCKYPEVEIVSVKVKGILSGKARSLEVVFKNAKESDLAAANMKVYHGETLKATANGVNPSGENTYLISLPSPGLEEGNYTFVLQAGTKTLRKEFHFELPVEISEISFSERCITLTLSKATATELQADAFTVTNSGESVAVQSVTAKDKKEYTLTFAGLLKDGSYTVTITLPDGSRLKKESAYTAPLGIESIQAEGTQTILVKLNKQTSTTFFEGKITKNGVVVQTLSNVNAVNGEAEISLNNVLEEGTYKVELTYFDFSGGYTPKTISGEFTYKKPEQPNNIVSVIVRKVVPAPEIEVEMERPTERPLTKEDMAILCAGGHDMTIIDVKTEDNQVYTVFTSTFVNENPNYTFSIQLPNNQIVQKAFVFDINCPHAGTTEVLRTEVDVAEFNLYDVDEACTLYYYIPGFTPHSEEEESIRTVGLEKNSMPIMAMRAAAASIPTADEVKEKANTVALATGYNKVVISGLTENQSYDLYYLLEDADGDQSEVMGPLKIGSEKITDPHVSEKYRIVSVVENPRNTITVVLNEAPTEQLTLQNFAFICPRSNPITISAATLKVSTDRKTYTIVIPENYVHKDNTYTAKVTFSDGSYAQKTFEARFNPPTVSGETISRPSETEVTLTFKSDKAGKCYLGTYKWNKGWNWDSNTPTVEQVVNRTTSFAVYERTMTSGWNSVTIPYKEGDTDIFVVYEDSLGNHMPGWATKVSSIPEYVPLPEELKDLKIETVSHGVSEFDGENVIVVTFNKEMVDATGDFLYDLEDITLSVVSEGKIPSRWAPSPGPKYDENGDISDYNTIEILYELWGDGLMPGTYSIQLKVCMKDDASKSVMFKKEFTVH